ncbi:class I SAM-dependent methyltransferase [Nocardia jiangsuensis]|uniref:Class I SAM-dependent methyltransferase n=1 Tax=Nocardia jiangsuensis TaxID=1691563 RepID=A0ABV8DT07_9NOCA
MSTWSPASEPRYPDVGAPQPDLLALVEQGAFHGEVLDAGCGAGALTLELASRGHRGVGIDLSTAAIATARTAAARRGLSGVTFEVADITALTGFDRRFGTVVDSALFHTLPASLRHDYQMSIVRAAAPGASYFALVFDRAGMPAGVPVAAVTAVELHDIVSAYWVVDEIRPARIHADAGAAVTNPAESSGTTTESERRSTPVVISSDQPFPAWLLSAHLA